MDKIIKNKKLILMIIIIIIFISVLVFCVFKFIVKNSNDKPENILLENPSQINSYSTNNITAVLGEIIPYTHKNPTFSLQYPKGFNVSKYDEEENETVVFKGNQKEEGFQIFINKTENEILLSKESIVKDFPELNATEIQEAIIGSNIRVFIFFGNNLSAGKTREVWFTNGKYFYQITSYASFDSKLAAIMSTWEFK